MSPATHYAGPCHEFQISGVTAREEGGKKTLPFQTHISYFIQQSGCCLQRERDREGRIYRDVGCLFLLILALLLLIFPRTQTRGFISWWCDSPWPRDREDGLSTASLLPRLILFPGVGWVWTPPSHHHRSVWPSFSTTLIRCGCLLPRSDQS